MKMTFHNCFLVFIAAVVGALLSQRADAAERYKRVKPDTSEIDTSGIFFKDVFREALRGERPPDLGSPAPADPRPPSGGDPTPMAGGEEGGGWSKVVSAQTIEDEVKRINLEVSKEVTTPTAFNGRGHRRCREYFSLLGMLFAIANEYSGDVRWKEDAATARDLFARAARNCKAASRASYNEAKLRKQDLADMVAGSRLQAEAEAKQKIDWSLICERSQLMRRIDDALSRLRKLTSSQDEFKSGADDVRHEGQMLAAMAKVLTEEGMPDGDDDDYAAFCDTMQGGAQSIVDAAKLGNFEAASSAMGDVTRACDDCHDIYR